jgi:hypothetical protein
LRLQPDVHPADGVLHGGAKATRPEVELITDVTLGAAIVDDLFGIRPVAPTSRFPNADVGILDGQQRNVVVIAVIKPVPPHNVVEILLDEVAQPPQVGVLPSVLGGDRPLLIFWSSAMASGSAGLQRYFSVAKKYLAPESSAAASPMSFRPLSGFRRLINLSIPSKHNASEWLASWKHHSKFDLT